MRAAVERGGVPVFRRPCGSFSSFSRADRLTAGGSPARPAAWFCRPTWMRPSRKVPAVSTTAGREADAHLRHRAGHPVALHQQVVHRLLEQPQVGLVLQPAADRGLVEDAVGLRPRGAHRRALAGVEDAELDAALVGGQRHGAAQRVHLLDQVALADAADAEGLQLICPSVSMLCVSSSVAQPMRAAARRPRCRHGRRRPR
jgi:hypothetical protein